MAFLGATVALIQRRRSRIEGGGGCISPHVAFDCAERSRALRRRWASTPSKRGCRARDAPSTESVPSEIEGLGFASLRSLACGLGRQDARLPHPVRCAWERSPV
jgi:hypothetical protein